MQIKRQKKHSNLSYSSILHLFDHSIYDETCFKSNIPQEITMASKDAECHLVTDEARLTLKPEKFEVQWNIIRVGVGRK